MAFHGEGGEPSGYTYMTDVCGFHVKNIPPGRETYEYRIAYISIYLCIYLSISISISIYHLYLYIYLYIYGFYKRVLRK